ncbi:GNAT family N-acetyltransferase [Nocardioides sp. MJB4]|uniref:GNAT family N-acetyltransferase n=2 Tax=Nocardioides donggukensis TaxID=2774019 RepID=A0A927Q1W6_9ACTN|nr:GNAT family N-acetyltransferase [Nocardioides donggukensis]
MRPEDVPVVERISATAFHELDARTGQPGWPPPVLRPPDRASAWVRRTLHLLGTDPGGCWVSEDESGLTGFAVSFTRELMWILASYGVRPELQGRGVGTQLLDAARHHGRGCLRGMLASSADPRAVRRYHGAGFTLHPQMFLHGRVDRSALPVVEKVRDGTAGDRDLLDSVDRRTRGAAHLGDHEVLLSTHRLVVSETGTGAGYAYVDSSGSPALLAATDRRTARRLLWEALASGPADTDVEVDHVTAANPWAIDVGMAAGLALHQRGYLALRGMKPPAPYLHHGSLL